MTLREYPDVEQGSDAWLELRRGIVTASTAGKLITAKTLKPASNPDSRSLTALLVAERITGWVEPTFVSADMLRGTEDEPIARDVYSEHFAPVTEIGFMIMEEDGFQLGFSPDGLVGDDGLVEIKSRRPKKQITTVLADEVPAENIAQIQAGLLVTGRAWCDYVSYSGGLALYVKRVYPDPRWHEAIKAAVREFEATAKQMITDYRSRVAGLPMTERSDYDQEIRIAS